MEFLNEIFFTSVDFKQFNKDCFIIDVWMDVIVQKTIFNVIYNYLTTECDTRTDCLEEWLNVTCHYLETAPLNKEHGKMSLN